MKDTIIAFIKGNPTVALTILTAYSWYCAYNYQNGYCSFFSVPAEYIDISTVDILKFASSIIGIAFIMYSQIFDVVKSWNNVLNGTLKQSFIKLLFAALLIGYWLLFFIAKLPIEIYYIYGGGVGLVLLVIILTYKKSPTEDVKVIDDAAISYWYLAGILLIIPLFCMYVGYGNASKKTNFEVLSDHKSVAVIRRYGDNIILKNFDKKSRKFGDSVFVLKLGPTNPLNLINVKLITD